MTEPSIAGQPLTEEQAAFLRARTAQQAAEASSGVEQEAAAAAAQMTERGPLLPAETDIERLMAQLKAQSEQLEKMGAALGSVQRQMEEAQVAAGGPLTVRYAQGAADKLDAMAAAYPNNPLGARHFDAPREAAGKLVTAAKAVVKSGAPVADVESAAAAIGKFFTRAHARAGGAHVDWSAIADDLELAVEEAAKLAAVA
jgi:hypothetical protein